MFQILFGIATVIGLNQRHCWLFFYLFHYFTLTEANQRQNGSASSVGAADQHLNKNRIPQDGLMHWCNFKHAVRDFETVKRRVPS